MIVSDEIDDFIATAKVVGPLADRFYMATTMEPDLDVDLKILPIPPDWLFPPDFSFLMMKKEDAEDLEASMRSDAGPNLRLSGPVQRLPGYTLVSVKNEKNDEGHIMPLSPAKLPSVAIQLMLGEPMSRLKEMGLAWLPYDRFSSEDRFLTDLRISKEKGMLPIYCGALPYSEAVKNVGRVVVSLGAEIAAGNSPALMQWQNSVMKIMNSGREISLAELFDLPNKLINGNNQAPIVKFEIILLEFSHFGELVTYPAVARVTCLN